MKTNAKFHVTYSIVTPESAETGDEADSGFVTAGEWKVSAAGKWGKEAGAMKADCALTLRDAVQLMSGPLEDNDYSLYEADARQDYHTGEQEMRALHFPDSISPASASRIRKLLCK